MKGVIYKYTSPSGKCYIGQTVNEDIEIMPLMGIIKIMTSHFTEQFVNMDGIPLNMKY